MRDTIDKPTMRIGDYVEGSNPYTRHYGNIGIILRVVDHPDFPYVVRFYGTDSESAGECKLGERHIRLINKEYAMLYIFEHGLS